MVQGLDILKIDVFHQKFNPNRSPHDPLCKLDITCVYTANDLRREFKSKSRNVAISDTVLYQCQWYFNVMLRIFDNIGEEYGRLRINNWLIESSCQQFFQIDNFSYDFIVTIVTPLGVNWFATKIHQSDINIFGTQQQSHSRAKIQKSPTMPYFHSMIECSVYETPCREKGNCTGNKSQKKFLNRLFKQQQHEVGRRAIVSHQHMRMNEKNYNNVSDEMDSAVDEVKEGDIVIHTYPITSGQKDCNRNRNNTVKISTSSDEDSNENVSPQRMSRLYREFYQILLRRRLAEQRVQQRMGVPNEDDEENRRINESLLQEFLQNLH